MVEETNASVGESVRCPECFGLTDALWRDDGDLTCSFCRIEPEDPAVRNEDQADTERPTPGAFFEGLRKAAERMAERKRLERTEET